MTYIENLYYLCYNLSALEAIDAPGEVVLSEGGVLSFKLVDGAVNYRIGCSAEGSFVGIFGDTIENYEIADGYLFTSIRDGLERYYTSLGLLGEQVKI